MRTALEIVFWVSCALIVWTQVGYAAALAVLARVRGRPAAKATTKHERPGEGADGSLPDLSLVVAAHDEQAVIAEKVANALGLDYPRERLQVIVACDGCTDATAARAREAGADLVLELPRGGKIRAQDAAVERARGEIVAFSDANAQWEPDAARVLVGAFEDPRVGYACGQVRFVRDTADSATAGPTAGVEGAPNQEGVYWRYERWSRACRRSRRATARSTRPAGSRTSSSTRSWATTFRCRSTRSSAACARCTCRTRAQPRRWSRRSPASSRASGG
jgi:hypothetical protein